MSNNTENLTIHGRFLRLEQLVEQLQERIKELESKQDKKEN